MMPRLHRSETDCRRHRIAAAVMVMLWLATAEVLGQGAAPNEQQPPVRRVRRRYDARVQLHSLEDTAPQQVPVEKKEKTGDSETPLTLDQASSLLKGGATPAPVVVTTPRARPKADDEEESSDDLWITSSVSTILGVNLTRTNSFISGNWGWLARDAQKAANTNRVARAQEQRREEASDREKPEGDEDEEENVAGRGPALIINPQPAATPSAPVVSADPSRHTIRFAPEPTGNRDVPNLGLAGAASRERPTLVGGGAGTEQSSAPAQANAPTPPPELTESRRRMEELSSSHRPEGWNQRQTPNSAELARVPLDAAATLPSTTPAATTSRPTAMDRPLLSGSPENYGRRGDIFSPSFRSSSLESGALPAPLWGRSDSSGFAPPPAVQPTPSSTLPSVRSTGGFSGVDLLKPFDPAGRAVTEPRRGW